MRYRVEELAARCDVTVDTVRYYQTKGLLPRPQREGRVAWYDDTHAERLQRIRDLKDAGFTLAMVARALTGELDAGEEALALALASPADASLDAGERLTRAGLAERTGVSPTLLEALEREGLLVGQPDGDGERRYDAADVEAVGAGMALLDAGVPLSELLELARRHDVAVRATAAHAVELFARFVRDPARAAAASETEAAERMVTALQRMLPATATLVTHHFRGRLLEVARARLEADAGEGGDGS